MHTEINSDLLSIKSNDSRQSSFLKINRLTDLLFLLLFSCLFSFLSPELVEAQSEPEISSVSWGGGRSDIFYRGSDNRLKHAWAQDGIWRGEEDLGGTMTSAPSAVSWGAGRIDVFYRGANNNLIHRWLSNNVWAAEYNFGGTMQGAPSAVTWAAERLDVFYRGSDNQLKHLWLGPNGWYPLETHGGNLRSDPSAVSWGVGRLDIFYKGADNRLKTIWLDSQGWKREEDRGGAMQDSPKALSWGVGRVDVFYRGADNALKHIWYGGGNFGPEESFGGSMAGAPSFVTTSAASGGYIELFYRGSDNKIKRVWFDNIRWYGPEDSGIQLSSVPSSVYIWPNGHKHIIYKNLQGEIRSSIHDTVKWLPERSLSEVQTNTPSSVSWNQNRVDTFFRGADGRLKHRSFSNIGLTGQSINESDLGGALFSSPSAVSWASDRFDVFYRGSSNNLLHRWYGAGSWAAEYNFGGSVASSPSAISWGVGSLHAFYKGSDSKLKLKSLTSSGWQAELDLGGQLAGAPSAVSWGSGRSDVVYRGLDNALKHRWYGTTWAPEFNLGGSLSSDPKVVTWGAGSLQIFYRAADNSLRRRSFANNAWVGEENLGGLLNSEPTPVAWGGNKLNVYYRGFDNKLKVRTFNGTAWQSEVIVGGDLNSSLSAITTSSGMHQVYYTDLSGALKLSYYASGAWNPEVSMLASGNTLGSWILLERLNLNSSFDALVGLFGQFVGSKWANFIINQLVAAGSSIIPQSFLDLVKSATLVYEKHTSTSFTNLVSLINSGALNQWAPPEEPISGEVAGTIGGSFTVTDGGSANYRIQIAVPPGTAERVPSLGIVYNSGGGNGLLGVGWGLEGLSSVTRCPTTIAQEGFIDPVDFDANDRFCIDGKRLVAISGTYGANGTEYRTENESFTKVISYGQSGGAPAYFVAWAKDGLVYHYGTTPDSALTAKTPTQQSAAILIWQLKKVADRSGNYLTYTYESEPLSSESYPVRIDYTANDGLGLAPYNSVRFFYENRSDKLTRYMPNAVVTTSRRLSRIRTYTENDLAWEYRLSYTEDPLSSVSKLIKIEECDAYGKCLPSSNFTWKSAIPAGYGAATSLANLSPAHGYGDAGIAPLIEGDWNGDGLTDIARVHHTGIQFFISNGAQFTPLTSFNNLAPAHGYANGDIAPILTGDWNGDGRTDVARVHHSGVMFYVSTGSNFVGFAAVYDLSPQFGYTSNNSYPLFTGDWNGDGRTDIARIGASGVYTYISTGSGFAAHFTIPNLSPQYGFADSSVAPLLIGDWNGDGLTDIARVHHTGVVAYTASSTGFVYYTLLSDLAPQFGYSDSSVYPVFTGDWNGDGLTDLARVHSSGILPYVSSGTGFVSFPFLPNLGSQQGFANSDIAPVLVGDWNGDGFSDIARVHHSVVLHYIATPQGFKEYYMLANLSPAYGYSSAYNMPIFSGDWNGDGYTDIARVASNGIVSLTQNGSETSLLQSITDGLGAQTVISYRSLTDNSGYTKGSGAVYPGVDVQVATRTVSSVETSDGLGGFARTNYRYYALRTDLSGRGSCGFSRMEVIDERTGIVKTTFFKQNHPYKGLPFKVETRLSNGTLLSRTEDTWNVINLPFGRYFNYVNESVEEKYDLNGSLLTRVATWKNFDENGNLGYVGVTHASGHTESTTNTYNNDTANWIIGQISSIAVAKKAPGKPQITRFSNFTYQAGTGLLLTEQIEPGHATLALKKDYTYDGLGNILSSTVSGAKVVARSSSKTYDSKGRFVIKETNALGHSENREYDNRHGKVTKLTGPNGLSTSWKYDSFGRAVKETRADGTFSESATLKAASGAPGGSSYYTYDKSTVSVPVFKYFDVLGREVRSETRGFDGQKIFVDRVYNSKGQLAKTSDPYFEGDAPIWTVNEYDVLGRTIKVTTPGNRITSSSYNGFTTTVTDSKNQSSIRTVNSQGNLIEARDAQNNRLVYDYDSYGNLLTLTDPAGNITSITYDMAGKRLSINDPNTGITSYTYNALGELLSERNALSQTVSYTYDLLGRMISKVTPEGTSKWVYDTATYGKGKLARVTGPNSYSQTLSYDSLSRALSTTEKIAGTTYKFTNQYDQYSRISKITYPSGFKLTHHYNPQGALYEVRNGDSGQIYWRAETFNARGQLERQTLGNGLLTTQVFDQNTGLIKRIFTGNVQDLGFTFDSLGNLTSRSDNLLGLNENFTYDTLNRVLTATVPGQAPLVMTYDALGNITSKSDVGTYTYGAGIAGPNAVTSISGPKANTYTYDAVGNRLTHNGGSVAYTSFNKPKLISKYGEEVEFKYGPSSEKLEQKQYTNGTLREHKIYVGGLYEKTTAGSSVETVHYIRGGGGVVATYTTKTSQTPVTRYLLRDHLGSVQAITDQIGNIVERLSYDAWGMRRNPSTWAPAINTIKSSLDKGFTGHEQLETVDLIHMGGRVYDPVIGRFLSADPFVQSPDDLQNLNRYTYVLNNPLSITDPSGFFFKKLLKIAAVAFVAWVAPQYVPTLIGAMGISGTAATFVSGAVAGVIVSTASTAINGGNLLDGFKAGIRAAPFAGFRAVGADFVGDLFGHKVMSSWAKDSFGDFARAAKAVAHGGLSGAISVAQGGDFKSAFLTGAIAEGTAGSHPLVSIVAGGAASAVSGGKFADGVFQTAMIHAFNWEYGDYCPPEGCACGFFCKLNSAANWVDNTKAKFQYSEMGYKAKQNLAIAQRFYGRHADEIDAASIAVTGFVGGLRVGMVKIPVIVDRIEVGLGALAMLDELDSPYLILEAASKWATKGILDSNPIVYKAKLGPSQDLLNFRNQVQGLGNISEAGISGAEYYDSHN